MTRYTSSNKQINNAANSTGFTYMANTWTNTQSGSQPVVESTGLSRYFGNHFDVAQTNYLTASGNDLAPDVIAQYALPTAPNSPGTWYLLGTFAGSLPSFGNFTITVTGSGFAASSANGQQIATITGGLGSGSAALNFSGLSALVSGGNATGGYFPIISAVTAAATGASTSATNASWDIWVQKGRYATGFYTVQMTAGSTWTPNGSSGTPPTGAYALTGGWSRTRYSSGNIYNPNGIVIPSTAASWVGSAAGGPVLASAVLGSGAVPTMTQSTPADNTTCTAGQMWSDTSYICVCVASGIVKRSALSTF